MSITIQNLLRIEDILKALNVEPRQVSIEAKVVEIEQTNLNTLGFEWSILAGTVSFNPAESKTQNHYLGNSNANPYHQGNLGIGNKIGGLAASGVTNTVKLGISKGVQATKAVGGTVANAKFLGKDGEKSMADYGRAAKAKVGRGVSKMVQYLPRKAGKFMGALGRGLGRRDTSE